MRDKRLVDGADFTTNTYMPNTHNIVLRARSLRFPSFTSWAWRSSDSESWIRLPSTVFPICRKPSRIFWVYRHLRFKLWAHACKLRESPRASESTDRKDRIWACDLVQSLPVTQGCNHPFMSTISREIQQKQGACGLITSPVTGI